MSDAGTGRAGGFTRLLKDSALYAVGSIAGKAAGILLLPILTRWLPTAEFGKADLFSTAQSTGASIALLGMDLAATRLYADTRDVNRRNVFGSWGVLAACIAGAMFVGSIVAARPLSLLLADDGDHAATVALTGAAIVGSVVQLVALTALRNQQRPVAHAALSAATFGLYGVLVAVFAGARPDATSVIAALAVSLGFGAVATLIAAWPLFRSGPSLTMTKRLVRLGGPVLPAVVATWVAEVVNRTLLIQRASATEVAYFSLAVRCSSVVMLIVLGFQAAWQPTAFALGDSPEGRQRVARDGRRILTGVSVVVAAGALVAPELVRVIAGEAYRPAVRVVGISLVSMLGYAALQVAAMPSSITMDMRDVGMATALAATAGMLLNAWWAASGAWATAAAIGVGLSTGALVANHLGSRRTTIRFGARRLGPVMLGAGCVAIAATWTTSVGALERVILGLALLGLLALEGSVGEVLNALRARRASHR